MSRARSSPPELPGFTFVGGIGGGGFADVFLYTQHAPNRSVAMKVLRSEHISDVSLRQFETEANVMAEVSTHPYIVNIFSTGVAPDGRPFIVMEYYPGDHFGLRARGGGLSLAEVLSVGIRVSSAVETAHRAGILHRDIKPANILTSAYGHPGLTDFGIAGVRIEGAIEAAAAVSVAFAPPEVLIDDSAAGSELSDVYSLGATVYALLAGRSPLWIAGGDNTDAAMMQRVIAGNISPLAAPEVPAALTHLLTNAMSIDPGHRPQSALAFAHALQDIEQSQRLPVTRIEVRDDAPAPPPARSVHEPEDDELTRRGTATIVDPDGGTSTGLHTATPAGASASNLSVSSNAAESIWATPVRRSGIAEVHATSAAPAGAPITADDAVRAHDMWAPKQATVEAPAAIPGAHVARSLQPGLVDDDGHTVRRPAAADMTEGEGSKRALYIGGGIAATVAVLVVLVLGLRPSGEQPAPTTPPTITLPDAVVADPPTDVQATFTDDQTVRVTFKASADPAASPRYRITRTDGGGTLGWPAPVDQAFVDVTVPEATIGGFGPDDRPCLTVSAIVKGQLSEASKPVCAARPAPAPLPQGPANG